MKIFKTLSKRGLALFLVLTMCASLLPATALAAEYAEITHVHNEDGWTCVEEAQLICGYEQEHIHDETCWETSAASGDPVCGLEESAGHQHDDSCYTEETVLTCGQEESEEHPHDESCYTTEFVLSCGQEETEGHTHGEDCFAAGEKVLVCELEEHEHSDECYESVWTCTPPTADVTRFLQAVKAIPKEITAQNVEEAEARIAEAIAAYQHLGGPEKTNASVGAAYDAILAAEIAVEAAKKGISEAVLPENAVVLDPADLVEYNDGFEEEALSVADLFTFAANAYLVDEEDPDVVSFPTSLYFVGEDVDERFDFMDAMFLAESGDALAEEPETVALTRDAIIWQGIPVTVYFLPEDTATQDELLMAMGNDDVALLAANPVIDRPTGNENWATATLISDENGLHCLCHEGKYTGNNSISSHAWMKKQPNGQYEIVASASIRTDLGTIAISDDDISYIHCFGQKEASDTNKGNWKGVSQDIQVVDPSKIEISKTAYPRTVSAGETVKYTITINNVGGSESESISISDSFLTSGKISANNISGATVENGVITTGKIPAGGKCVITYSYTTTVADIGNLTNTVSVPGMDDVMETVTVTDKPTASVVYEGNGGKLADGKTTVTETAERGTYTVKSNDGPDGIGFTRDGYTFVKWTLDQAGTQDAGTTQPLTDAGLRFYAQWTDVPPVIVTPDPDPENPEDPEVKGVAKTAADEKGPITSVQVGDTVTYTVTVTPATENADGTIPGLVRNIKIEDPMLLKEAEAASSLSGVITVKVGGTEVPPEEVKLKETALIITLAEATRQPIAVTYSHKIEASDLNADGTQVTNTVDVTVWNETEDNASSGEDEKTLAVDQPDVSVKKIITSVGDRTFTEDAQPDSSFKAYAGETITWEITVTNRGSAAATGFEVSETFTGAGTLTIYEATKNPDGTIVPGSPITLTDDGKFVVDSLDGKASKTYVAACLVKEADKGKTISNAVAVDGKESTTDIPVSSENAIVIEKTAKVDGKVPAASDKAGIGSTITYEIKVINNGNRDLTDLDVVDDLTATERNADGTTVVHHRKPTTPKDVSYDQTTGKTTFTIDNLPCKTGNNTKIITYTYTVAAEDAGLFLKNTAVCKPDETPESKGETPEIEVETLKISKMEKTLVTSPTAEQAKLLSNVKAEDGKLVVINNDQPITLLYKITIEGDVGAKFTLSDNGAKVVGDSVTLGQETTLAASKLEVYVTMIFTKNANGEYVNTSNGGGALTNKATVTPGKGTDIPDPKPEQPTSKSYTVTVKYVDATGNMLYKYVGGTDNQWTYYADYTIIVPEGSSYDVSGQAHAERSAVTSLNGPESTVNVTYVLYDMEVSPSFVEDDVDSMAANSLDGIAYSDITITLKYKPADLRYTVEYYRGGEMMAAAPANAITGGAAHYGETVTLTAVEADKVDGTTAAAFPNAITDGKDTYVYDKARPATATVTSENRVIKVYYMLDNKGGEKGGSDGIPDEYEAFVEYKSVAGATPVNGIEAGQSLVDSISATHDLRVYTEVGGERVYELNSDKTVKLKTSINADSQTAVQKIDAANETSDGYAFDNWTTYDNRTISTPALGTQAINGVTGGKTYTFTANYAVDSWHDADPEDPDDKDSETGGDGIPDKYQAIVHYVSNDTVAGTVDPTVQIFTSEEVNGAYLTNWTMRKTANSTAQANEGYAFAYWSAEETGKKGGALSVESVDAALSKDLFFSSTDNEKTFYAFFLEDKKGPDNKPDKTPDEWQVFVNFAAGEGGELNPAAPAAQVFDYYQKDASGKYAVNSDGSLTPVTSIALTAAVTAVPDSGMAFDKWELTSNKTGEGVLETVNVAMEKDALGDIQVINKTLATGKELGVQTVIPGATYTYTAYFDKDVVNKDNPDNSGSDGIPDKYEAVVTFQIAKDSAEKFTGTWEDKTTKEKHAVVLLYKNGDETKGFATKSDGGKGRLTDAQIPKGTANSEAGYSGDGTWSRTVPVKDSTVPTTAFDITEANTFVITWGLKQVTYSIKQHFVSKDGKTDTAIVNAKFTVNGKEVTETTAVYGSSIYGLINEKLKGEQPYNGVIYLYDSDRTGCILSSSDVAEDDGNIIKLSAANPGSLTVDGTVIHLFYDVDSWNEDANKEIGGDNTPDKKQILAKYVADSNGSITGKTVEVKTVENGKATISGSSAEADKFYHFEDWTATSTDSSWDYDASQLPAEIPNTMLTVAGGNTYTFTATFEANVYTVIFDANGGSWEGPVSGYTMGTDNVTAAIALRADEKVRPTNPAPACDGSEFTGWYTAAENGKPLVGLPLGMTVARLQELLGLDSNAETMTLYAGWKNLELSYSVRHHFINGNQKTDFEIIKNQKAEINTEINDLIAKHLNAANIQDGNNYVYWEKDTKINGSVPENLAAAKLTNDKTVIDLYFYVDNWHKEDPGKPEDTGSETGGDGIPDKYQVLVKFTSDQNGEVSGKLTQVFGAGADSLINGMVEFAPTSDSVVKKANPGYTFDIWTQGNDGIAVNPFTTGTAPGGTEITYTAHFDKDVIGGTDPENPNYPGDGIPDKYQVIVMFAGVNGTVDGKTQAERVVTLVDENGNWSETGSYTLAAEDIPATAPAEGYTGEGAWDVHPVGARITNPDAEEPDPDLKLYFVITFVNGECATSVEFYFNDVKDESLTEKSSQIFESIFTFTPEKDLNHSGKHYALDKIENNSLRVSTDPAKNVVSVYYALDEVGTDPEEPGKPGDNIPDKYQAVVRFESANKAMGTVEAENQIFTFKDNEGNYATSGAVTPNLTKDAVKVNPVGKNQLAYWTKDGGSDAVDPAARLSGVKGDTVIVFYAHFAAITPTPDASADLTATGRTWVYDGRAHGTTATVTGVDGYVIEYSVDGGVTWSSTAPTVTNVSEGTRTVSVRATKAGYETLTASYTIAINPRPMTITVRDLRDQRYTGSTIGYTGTAHTTDLDGKINFTDLVAGDAITSITLSGQRTTAGTYPGELTASKAVITRNGVDVTANYEVSYVPGTLSIILPNDPVTPGGGGGGGGGTTIPDGPTPLAPDPGTTISDQEVPLAAPGLNNTDHFDYIKGYVIDGQILVRPEANITRAEVATIFFRLMTKEFREANWATENDFTDVKKGDWYNNAISTCTKAGILKGYEDGSFKPNQTISREEFAAIAARFASEEVPAGGMFKDIAGRWSEKDIERAAAMGWIKGSNGMFRPTDKITRAEVIVIVNRMLDRVPDADHMLPDMKTFPDNTPDMWWYADVQEATNSHEYDRAEDGVTGIWTSLLPEQDWAALEKEWATAADANVADVAPKLGGEAEKLEEEPKVPETAGGDDGKAPETTGGGNGEN